MRKPRLWLFVVPALAALFCLSTFAATTPQPEKEWTVLVFMNGNNNLDSFTTSDMNEMEQVGTTENVNLVVQWASEQYGSVRRVLVAKDDSMSVTSPVLEDMGRVDMGDWKNLVEFVRWGVANFPAKKYFIDVWNHGSGWHRMMAQSRGIIRPMDISFDDISGHAITTAELGMAMDEAAKIIGHKVDLYGSDACLMGMFEVAAEMQDSVKVFLGSEETEPGDGWPYGDFMEKWKNKKSSTPAEVARMLIDAYFASYQGGSQGNSEVTLSAFDLTRMEDVTDHVRALGQKMQALDPLARRAVLTAAKRARSFAYSDYKDYGHFISLLKADLVPTMDLRDLEGADWALSSFVIANKTSAKYASAKGAAIWLPTTSYALSNYQEAYGKLRFAKDTNWGLTLKKLFE